MHTHMNRPNSCLLVRFSLCGYIVCYSLPVLDLAVSGLFCLIVYLCMCAFVVLDLVSSVLCQEIGRTFLKWLILCRVGHKTLTQSVWTDGSVVFARWCHCAPLSNTCFLGPTRVHILNGISIGSAVLAHLTAPRPCTLQWAVPFPTKNCFTYGGSEPQSDMRFLGPVWVHNSNGT